jgi:putative transposase
MPNHFHFLLYTDERCNEHIKQGGLLIDPVTNDIRKLLSGYAWIFNNKYDQSGSLFRQKTKSKLICQNADISKMNDDTSNACFNCFNYIYQNPFKAGLISGLEDWEFSSFKDYAGLRNGSLCNKKSAQIFCMYNIKEFIQISSDMITENKIKYI